MERCDEVRAAMAEGSLHLHPELEAHAASCELCRELQDASGALGAPHGPNTDPTPGGPSTELLFTKLEAELERERGLLRSLRSLPTWARRGLAIGGLWAGTAALLVAEPKRPLDSADLEHRFVGLFALSTFVIVALWSALRPLHRAFVRSEARAGLCLGAIVAASIVGLAPSAGFWTDPSAPWPVAIGLPCLAFGLMIAAATYTFVRLFDRDPSGPSLLTAALAAGLAGDLALHLRCFDRDAQHVLIGHLGVIVLALLVAMTWSRRRSSLTSAGLRSP